MQCFLYGVDLDIKNNLIDQIGIILKLKLNGNL